MARIERGHEPVEEAPARRSGIEEQPVHLRGQPEQREPLGKPAQAALGRSVDAQQAPFAGILLDGCIAAGADLAFAVGPVETHGDGPGSGILAGGGIAAVDIAEAGLAQAAAGGEEGKRFQQVGLAGAVRPAQHHRPVIGFQGRLAIAAEIADGEAGNERSARSPARERRKGDDVGPGHHTRIGIST